MRGRKIFIRRFFVSEEFSYENSSRALRAGQEVGEVQVSVARYLRTPPYAAKRKDLDLVLRAAYAASATGARLSLATVILDR